MEKKVGKNKRHKESWWIYHDPWKEISHMEMDKVLRKVVKKYMGKLLID